MKFKEKLSELEKSVEFKNWKKEHSSSYLTYGFMMISPDVKKEWQIGYYNPDLDKITTFAVSDKITRNPDSEIFKDKKKVQELEKDKVKISLDSALEKADKVQREKYAVHTPLKKIAILQKLNIGQVWNITYITKTFKTLNIKVSSEDGEVLKYDLIELFKFDK